MFHLFLKITETLADSLRNGFANFFFRDGFANFFFRDGFANFFFRDGDFAIFHFFECIHNSFMRCKRLFFSDNTFATPCPIA